MLDEIIKTKSKIHSRDISLATWPHENSRIIVHGVLKDMRYINVFDVTGKILKPGVIHHMDVKMMIKSSPLSIEKIQARMIHVPMKECHTTIDTVSKLTGLEIKSGFSTKVRSIMGGKKGCTHLCHLIIVMGQEIVHGWLTSKRSQPLPVPESIDDISEKNFLVDSCRMWTENGPKMKSLEHSIKKHRA
jgi:tRNA U54 and U55 pseudouridine synthase Pus10